jgi:sortase A
LKSGIIRRGVISQEEVFVPKKRAVEDLSKEDLRNLLIEKSQKDREARIDAYRRSGRVIKVTESTSPVIPRIPNPENDFAALESGVRQRSRNRKKESLDRFLMAVEIVGVIGLVAVFIYGFGVLNNLNRQVSESLVQPSLTPTAIITAIVLPSGHTPPVEGSEVVFNESEIPEHLRPLMQSYAAIPIPTPRPQQARQIQIPAIELNAPVVLGDGWEQLKKGVGQSLNSADPGQQGNLVLSAHNDIFGEYFRDLDRLTKGDEIIIITQDRSFTYLVTRKLVVEPTRVDLMDSSDKSTITLISCYPYLVDNKRIVIQGTLQQ